MMSNEQLGGRLSRLEKSSAKFGSRAPLTKLNLTSYADSDTASEGLHLSSLTVRLSH
jgi:hypothetical protein